MAQQQETMMTDRFSANGDGKPRPSNNRISATGAGRPPAQPINPNERDEQIIKSLRERYDEIEAIWEEREADLSRFPIPEAAELYLGTDSDGGGAPMQYYLAFMRYGKGWRICHGWRICYSEVDSRLHDEENFRPVIECPLDVRLSMLEQFEELRKKVIEVAEAAVPKMDTVIAKFRKG
jgi:hypothetical protein